MSYQEVKPGNIKHKILRVLAASSDSLSQSQIVEAVEADGTKIKGEAAYRVHIRPLITYGLVEGIESDTGGSFWITIDGRLELKELDDKLEGRPKEGAVPPNRMPVSRDVYDGQELKRLTGIPADRYAAFDLPSVQLGWRVWPKHLADRPAPEKVTMCAPQRA